MNGDHSLAVHALVYLDHRATHLPSQILAENICTNAARVRKVMRPLASAGLIATKEGAEGGYALARPAAEIPRREHVDAGDLELGRGHRALVAADAEAGEVVGAHLGLLEQRRDEAVSGAAVRGAFPDGVDLRVVGLQRVVDHDAAVAMDAGRFGERGVRADADGHHDEVGRNLHAVLETDRRHPAGAFAFAGDQHMHVAKGGERGVEDGLRPGQRGDVAGVGDGLAASGTHFVDVEKATHLLEDQSLIASGAVFYAAIAGVCLFLAGLINGYFDNYAAYNRVPERILQLDWPKRLFGEYRMRRVANYIGENLGALSGNFLFGFLLGGSIVVEKVFNWPGLGRLLVDSVEMRDYPVIQAEVLLFSLEFILINLVVDVLYAAINPAIRYK